MKEGTSGRKTTQKIERRKNDNKKSKAEQAAKEEFSEKGILKKESEQEISERVSKKEISKRESEKTISEREFEKAISKKESEQNRYQHIKHEFEPVYDAKSRILILGTLPSVKSREQHFYYGHSRNRFWKVLAQIFGEERTPEEIQEKKDFLLRNGIAVWDVIEECDIIGSSDSSIKNVIPADIARILRAAPIEKIFANGEKAYQLYMKYIYPDTKREIVKLPSTSPANAAFGQERLAELWAEQIKG